MATLTEYFDTEARDFLAQLERMLAPGAAPDAVELHRAARGLRGTAQMAREDRVYRAVSAFEAVTRALSANIVSWSDDMSGRARASIADLRALVERSEEDHVLEHRAAAAVDRWRSAGIALPAHLSGSPPPADAPGTLEFREFAAREVTAIADALDKGVQQLAAEPMDRDPLKMILRRQRALLGAARLGEIPVVAEVLRAIEDLTRVIAKLDVGVKQEWLDIYRVAREALKATIEPLQRDEDPEPSHAVARLRHMREELLERYGGVDPAVAAQLDGGFAPPPPQGTAAPDRSSNGSQASAPGVIDTAVDVVERVADAAATAVAAGVSAAAHTVQAVAAAVSAPADEDGVVSIEELCYRPDDALRRALELRDTIMSAAADDPQARDAAEELFDLIRIAQG